MRRLPFTLCLDVQRRGKAIQLGVLLAVAFCCEAPPAAALSVFTDREAWNQAVQDLGAAIVTDPFDNNIAEAVTITLDSGIISTIIDPRVLNNSVTNGVYAANTRQGIPSIRWTFPSPVVAFGAYFISAANGAGLLLQGNFDGLGIMTVDLRDLINSLGVQDSFVGVIGDVAFSSITYQADDDPITANEAFHLDDASFAAVPLAAPVTTFSEDFESAWFGKGGGGHHALFVADPVRSGNNVVTFWELNAAGDIFSLEVQVSPGQTCTLGFEYLGDPTLGGNAGDLGGFIGFAESWPGRHRWLEGTALIGGAEDDALIDDGQWHSYVVDFDPYATFSPAGDTIRVMVEDFIDSGGVAGDAFFDNIELHCGAFSILIDIKPRSDRNPVNPGSQGMIPVAILTTSTSDGDLVDFDAWEVDQQSLAFGPDGAHIAHSSGHARDVDGDGDLDMVIHFRTYETGIACSDTEVTLTGVTLGGQPFEGRDSIRTVGCQ